MTRLFALAALLCGSSLANIIPFWHGSDTGSNQPWGPWQWSTGVAAASVGATTTAAVSVAASSTSAVTGVAGSTSAVTGVAGSTPAASAATGSTSAASVVTSRTSAVSGATSGTSAASGSSARASTSSSAAAASVSCGYPGGGPTATIDVGVVIGTTTSLPAASASVNKFLGVPFAQSPPLRFAPAVPPAAFSAPINATAWKPACIQQFNYPLAAQQLTQMLYNTPAPVESEDCKPSRLA
ncbi:hypothetical protein BAUCODRAFT_401010 [Baudoinia panamericana UAMH 10762]|uniref:Carboxylesterase type B domain-containing protein n=1 Tax=Baudoinia panamericana (strain UAMH 10762) TaxID=717646 RepID=M2LXF1_BAUPA|nr:uncharacterized protein BAUCODRAFT_401010 [Baudoinia panamericana UAMH 10762]EMC99377.1 hypothetical protein BAUCODRAFT_401010 [Baudoinia panamericana UAMH 10762]